MQGFLLLAKGGAVTQAHIDTALKYALESGMEAHGQDELRQLGALWLRFEAVPPGTHSRAIAQPATRSRDAVVQPMAANTMVAPAEKPRRTRFRVLATAFIVMVAIGLGVWRLTMDDSIKNTLPVSLHPDRPLEQLTYLDVEIRLPAGWHEIVPNSAAGPEHELVQTAVVFHGGTVKDPDHLAFLGVTPWVGLLSAGSTISDEDLVKATKSAVQGAVAQLPDRHQLDGCVVTDLKGRRTGFCFGSLSRADRTVTLRTYLLLGKDRGVIALFVAKDSVVAASEQEELIVASLLP